MDSLKNKFFEKLYMYKVFIKIQLFSKIIFYSIIAKPDMALFLSSNLYSVLFIDFQFQCESPKL